MNIKQKVLYIYRERENGRNLGLSETIGNGTHTYVVYNLIFACSKSSCAINKIGQGRLSGDHFRFPWTS